MNAQEMQDAAAVLDGQTQPTGETLEQAPAQDTQAPVQEKTTPSFDAQQEVQRLREEFNRANSELGQLRKMRSEFEGYKKTQNQPTVPKSWQELDEPTRKATAEMVEHIFREKYGDRFDKYDKVAEGYEVQERNTRILGLATEILGSEFEKYNKPLGDIYSKVKQDASAGDTRAERFLNEIHNTDSGVFRLIDMAKAQASQSMQAQSEKAKLEQEAKAKRVSTNVGGGKPVTSSGNIGKDGLPTDKAEKLAAMRSQLDDYYTNQT